MHRLIVFATLLIGCGAKNPPNTLEEPASPPIETTQTPQDDTRCLGVDCEEGSQCVNGQCVPNDNPEVVNKTPDRCLRISCASGQRCVDGGCVSNVVHKDEVKKPDTVKDHLGTYFDACGCGCCGKPMKEVCLNTQEEYDKKQAEVAERRKGITPQGCSNVGCSSGVRYKLCL